MRKTKVLRLENVDILLSHIVSYGDYYIQTTNEKIEVKYTKDAIFEMLSFGELETVI